MTARLRAVAILTAALLALTGCTGFQKSGEVTVGLEVGEIPPVPFSFTPSGPQAGAEPREIVQGFLAAAIAPDGGWSAAKEFLSDEFANDWDPSAGTVVDTASRRTVIEPEVVPTPTASAVPEAASLTTVSLTVTTIATVDASGVYRVSESSEMQMDFELQTQPDGQWRITSAPDGVLLDRFSFENVFDDYDLAFYDPTWTFLVPDTRWYPHVTAVRDIVNGLVEGPAPWLAGAVSTAVPEGARALASIPIDNNVASITLAGTDSLEADAIGRLKLQLTRSLSGTAVREVVLSSSTRELTAPIATVTPTTVPTRALVGTEAGFGYFTSGGLDPLDDLDEAALGFPVVAWEMSEAAGHGVALSRSGEVVRLNGDSPENVTIDVRPGLIEPTLGPFGDIWTVPADTPGALTITMQGGEATQLPGTMAELTKISHMQLSRDGTRLAVVGLAGSQAEVIVYSVLRGADGTVLSLGKGNRIRDLRSADVKSLSWVDDTSIGLVVANETDSTVIVQPLSGPAVSSRAVADVVDIAGSSDPGAIWIRTSDGKLYSSRGTTWALAGSGILVLARQQGAAVAH
ncbi:LpqB family beta-propeller domain-containing protein [Microbacterium mitrae]|uniref:Uncharacterized protein n=1 Tax=Microbacterium mitrae TaxID=664640 RepID=A0A5C8HPY9_9MICO|nr:LpqB family beta-propeller domain-containing protein [Microbacterium mitrae]TXK06074.1 hypothetical protein FVP60_03650 [Microbacterium mitrae]